ncbi:MAG: ATPase [Saprospirales bacterium]|nr:MAG: ATPase [Saprospirales bacterium]
MRLIFFKKPDLKSPKRVVITGPESSGKSTLANAIGDKFNLPVVEEYAVEYLSEKRSDYSFEDILEIARGQRERELQATNRSKGLIICDTSMLVLHIWSKVRFQTTDPLILKWLEELRDDLFLLCKPDIPWEPGPYRENPHDREDLYSLYLDWLRNKKYWFGIIEGDRDTRFEKASTLIEPLLSKGKKS